MILVILNDRGRKETFLRVDKIEDDGNEIKIYSAKGVTILAKRAIKIEHLYW